MDSSAPPPVPPPAVAARSPLPEGIRGWMSFVGFVTLIYGAIQILTCLGAIQGILLVIAGVAVLGARTALEAVDDVDPALAPFFAKLKTVFVMTGIGYIVTVAILALVFLLYFGVIMAAIAGSAMH
jgi:hypothetical protein